MPIAGHIKPALIESRENGSRLFTTQADFAQHIASLIDPAKLATLGKRGTNIRITR